MGFFRFWAGERLMNSQWVGFGIAPRLFESIIPDEICEDLKRGSGKLGGIVFRIINISESTNLEPKV